MRDLLHAYLNLEEMARDFAAIGWTECEDLVLDAMDSLHKRLSPEDIAFLDSRTPREYKG